MKTTIANFVKDLMRLLQKHWIVAGLGFAIGMIGWIAISRATPKQFTGSALIAWNEQAPPAVGLGAEMLQHEALANQLRQVTANLNWAAITDQYRPYPKIQATSGLAKTAAYLASQVSIQQVAAPALGGEAIQIGYTAGNRDAVLGVIDAVADGFAKTAPSHEQAAATPAPGPLEIPVILPAPKRSRKFRHAEGHKLRTAAAKPGPSAALLSAKLQASLAAGEELQQTLSQNTNVLTEVRDSLQKLQAQAKLVAPPPIAPAAEKAERKPSAQEEQLKADIAKAERNLADLKTRYTDEYPEVVAAKDRVRDLQLDLDRITAASNAAQARAAAAPKPKPEQQRAPDTGPLLAQLSATEAVQSRLQQDIALNQNETATLRTALAKAKEQTAFQSAAIDDSLAASASVSPDTLPLDTPSSDTSASNSLSGISLRNDSTSASNDRQSGTNSVKTPDALQSPFFLASEPTITTRPAIFAESLEWPVAFLCGLFIAVFSTWFVERLNPAIRSERMLHRELPPSAVYLGGIPRIKHEVISD
jgi:hypothetical protein